MIPPESTRPRPPDANFPSSYGKLLREGLNAPILLSLQGGRHGHEGKKSKEFYGSGQQQPPTWASGPSGRPSKARSTLTPTPPRSTCPRTP